MYKLNIKDKKILAELDLDARQSNSEIGKKVRLSKEVVKYRIDNLIDAGVILRFHTVINYFKLGIAKYKLYLQLKNVDKEKQEEIGGYLNANHNAEWVATCTGKWDLIAGFLVTNINELDDNILEFTSKYHMHIQDRTITTTLYLVHHLREYLQSSQKDVMRNVVYHTAMDSQVEIDEIDRELLKLLANNARMPVTEIAQKLKTTTRIVQYRMQQLEKKQIILAYKCHLDTKALGKIFCKAIFRMSNITKKRLREFISYSSSIKEAVWPQRVIGNWDFELDLEMENYEKFQEVISEIKANFSDIIIESDFAIVSKEYKLDLFPNAYPQLK